MVAFGLYFVSGQLSIAIGDHEVSVGHIEVGRDALRMVNPKIEGVNRGSGAYVVTADYAEQDVASPTVVELTGIRANLDEGDDWSRLTAPQGTFDTRNETLTLFGAIEVSASSGMTGRLTTATVDMKKQRVRSQQPVAFEFLNGTVDAQEMALSMDDRVVLFTGNVRVQMRKRPGEDKVVQAQ